MEVGEYGLTRGKCFVVRRLEVVAVAGLLAAVDFVVCFGCGGISCFFPPFFFFERARNLLQL